EAGWPSPLQRASYPSAVPSGRRGARDRTAREIQTQRKGARFMTDVRPSFITPEMREICARDFEDRVYETMVTRPICESDIMKWAIAVYYPEVAPRLFWDPEYAKRTEHGGIVAPEEFNPFNWQPLIPLRESDCVKSERYFGLEVPGVTRGEMNGGEEVEYTDLRVRPGDLITRKAAI